MEALFDISKEYLCLSKNAIESTKEAILLFDEHACISSLSLAACQLLGYPMNELLGRSYQHLDPSGESHSFDAVLNLIRAQKILTEDKYVYRKSGTRVPVSVTAIAAEHRNHHYICLFLRKMTTARDVYTLKTGIPAEPDPAENRLQKEIQYLRSEIKSAYNFQDIIAKSRSIKEVLFRVSQVAPSDTTVLITGETGTGKELIARAIHNNSNRRNRVMIKVNCAALPSNLIESELFGHEKGAFTGAYTRNIGRFELADGTSLFLDEIADLPMELQAKLLRVIQDGEFERVGSSKTIRTDVRIITATNRDLESAVSKGAFREDLYYRLNVFPIHIPPLRERREDIPILVQHFVQQYSIKKGKKSPEIPDEIMKSLQEYDWPGNVRELENVIERAVIISKGKLDLGGWLPRSAPSFDLSGIAKMNEVERVHILRILEQTRWRISGEGGAAALLGLKRTTLIARMKKLGIARHIR